MTHPHLLWAGRNAGGCGHQLTESWLLNSGYCSLMGGMQLRRCSWRTDTGGHGSTGRSAWRAVGGGHGTRRQGSRLPTQSAYSAVKPRLTLCDLWTVAQTGFSVHGILQATILEWVAMCFSKSFLLPDQGSSPHLLHLLHRQVDSLPLSHQGSPHRRPLSSISMIL